MERENESIHLLDMARCEPASALSKEFERGKWTMVPYSMDAGAGTMLFCGPDTQAPPLRLRPGVEGWHHIFVGTYRGPQAQEACLLIKLGGDPGYTRSVPETFRPEKDYVDEGMMPGHTDLCEAYWKTADLTGEEIVFHRPTAGSMAETTTNIAYLRLVPCSPAEQDRAQRDRTRTDTRRLIANYDGGQHLLWAYATEREMVDEFQALAESDFKVVLWGCAYNFGTFYPSRVGSEVRWAFGLPGIARNGRAAVDRRRRHGFDPLKAAVRCAHDIGIRIYPQIRMEGEQLPPMHRGYGGPGEFQRQHPEFRCVTRRGHRTRHLSQAFPEVRAKYLDLFREWTEDYGGDGVNIIFCRSWPYVLYEEPVVESFRDQFSLDIKALDPFDERVLGHRAGFLTQLLRETRAMLDEVGRHRNQRLGTCYVIPGDTYTPEGSPDLGPFTTPRSLGMDVETWVREGLVDELVVHLEDRGQQDAGDMPGRLRPYRELVQGTTTELYVDLYPRRQSADSMRVRAMACYDAGADGLCFWDSHGRAGRLSGWAMHRLLGHREELAKMGAFARSLFRLVPMRTLDGFDLEDDFGLPTDG